MSVLYKKRRSASTNQTSFCLSQPRNHPVQCMRIPSRSILSGTLSKIMFGYQIGITYTVTSKIGTRAAMTQYALNTGLNNITQAYFRSWYYFGYLILSRMYWINLLCKRWDSSNNGHRSAIQPPIRIPCIFWNILCFFYVIAPWYHFSAGDSTCDVTYLLSVSSHTISG